MSQIILQKTTSPETPLTNKVTIYAKPDGLVYSKNDLGQETLLSNSEVVLLDHINGVNPHPQYLLKSNSRKIEYITITPVELANKKIVLDKTPINPQFVQVDIKEGGGPLFFGTDFIVEGNELKWDGFEFDFVVGIDDKIRIVYDHT
jgi:hypothetical protein